MKKLIVAVSLLLIAALALSVSAFGAANYGETDYNLGNFTAKAPVLDGAFGADEYTTVYTLNAAAGYLEKDATVNSGKILSAAANAAGVTKSIKVGLAHDAAYIYIAIEATLGEGVADAKYNVWGLDMIANEDEANDTTANEFSAIKNNVFVGEIKFAKADASDVVTSAVSEEVSGTVVYADKYFVAEGTEGVAIIETTYDDAAKIINKGVWNAVRLTGLDKLAANSDFVFNTITVGAVAVAGPEVSVDIPAVVEPVTTEPATTEPATTEPATTEPATTEPATTEPATTEPATTEPATTEPVVTEPATTEPATTEPEPAKEGCGSSISAMGIALVAVLGAGAVVLSKKED